MGYGEWEDEFYGDFLTKMFLIARTNENTKDEQRKCVSPEKPEDCNDCSDTSNAGAKYQACMLVVGAEKAINLLNVPLKSYDPAKQQWQKTLSAIKTQGLQQFLEANMIEYNVETVHSILKQKGWMKLFRTTFGTKEEMTTAADVEKAFSSWNMKQKATFCARYQKNQ